MTDDLTLHKKGTPAIIANRIVGYGEKPADQFQAHPLNWRKHPQRQRAAVEASLRELGWIGVVIENVQTGNLIDGHERVWQALRAGGDVPYIQVDLTPEEEALALATFDAITNMAETDAAKLDELLRDVSTGEAALMELMAETAKEAGLFLEQPDEADAEPQIDRADELRQQWGVETGQLWRLPSRTPGQEHRLICGDCTDAAVVDRVMGGERAALAPVDPPYNVGFEYDGQTVDDAKTLAKFEEFSRAWFGVCQSVSERQIVTPGCYNLAWWVRWFDPYHWGTWTKTNALSPGRVSHFWIWEPVFFHGQKWKRDRANDLFNYPIGLQKDTANHPCPKPIKMWVDLIENYSDVADVIYEAFNGSGTTIIAAENLARQCRAVEISPGYVAVALQRYQDAFGITAELVE